MVQVGFIPGVVKSVAYWNIRTIPLRLELTAFLLDFSAALSMMYGQQQKIKADMARRNGAFHKPYQRLPLRDWFSFDRLGLVVLFLILISHSHPTFASVQSPPQVFAQDQSLTSQAVNGTYTLECLQVKAPVLNPNEGCQQILMVHTFAESYGKPFVGKCLFPVCHVQRLWSETITLSLNAMLSRFWCTKY